MISLSGLALVGWQFDRSYQEQQKLNQIKIEINEIKHLQGMFNHFMTTIDLFFSNKQSYLVVGIKKQFQQLIERINTLTLTQQHTKKELLAIKAALSSTMQQVEHAALIGPKSDQQWFNLLSQLDHQSIIIIEQYQLLKSNVEALHQEITQALNTQNRYLSVSFLASTVLTLLILILLGIINSRKIIKPINQLEKLTQENQNITLLEFDKAPLEIKHIASNLITYLDALAKGKLKAEQDKTQIEAQNNELQQTITMLEQTRQQLVHTEKLASLGQLAAGVAHEINNPIAYVIANQANLSDYLNDIKAYLKLIESPHCNAEQRAKAYQEYDIDFIINDIPELLSSTQDGLNRVKTIVHDLRVFTHNGNEEYELIDAQHLVNQALTLAKPSLSHHITVKKQFAENLPPFKGVASRLIQVMLNLIVNANDAIEGKGTITIKTHYCPTQKQVLISVQDTGCGIDESKQQNIFDPFFTTKPVGKGTGLGLHICHSIIASHNGDIKVESEKGKGCCFTLSFQQTSAVNNEALV